MLVETTATLPSPSPISLAMLTPLLPSSMPADLDVALLLPTIAANNPRLNSALLAANDDLDAHRDDRHSTLTLALTLANASGSADAISTLLDDGAWVDPAAPNLPFHAVTVSGCADLISLLIGSCPVPAWARATTPDGRTPVHTVAAVGNLDTIYLCIAFDGNDPNRTDSREWTPLHYATTGSTWMLLSS